MALNKGLSPVVTVVVLVLVGIVAGVVIYAVTSGFVGEDSSVSSGKVPQVVIEEVMKSDGILVLMVRNDGTEPAVVDRVYFIPPSGTVILKEISPVKIPPHSVGKLTVPIPSGLGKVFKVKVGYAGSAVGIAVNVNLDLIPTTRTTLSISGWKYYRIITVSNPNPYQLTDYPIRIQLTSSNFDFTHAQADGSDVRFRLLTDLDTDLPYWIEYWDPGNNEGVIWVKIPNIPANGSVKILMLYGNSSLTSVSNITAIWGSDLVLYWTFDQQEQGYVKDYSGNGYDGLLVNSSETLLVEGRYGRAMYFPGKTSDYIILNPFSGMPTDNITVAFWMWSNDDVNYGTPFSYATPDSPWGNEFLIYNYNNMRIYVNDRYYENINADVADGTWHYVVVQWSTAENGWLRVIIDGNVWYYETNLDRGFADPIQSGGSLVIANEQDNVTDKFQEYQAFKGIIDELRIYGRILDLSEIKYADVEPSVDIGEETVIT